MEQGLVSVIITTHNRAPEFILRALRSVYRQTFKKLQIIVVDDSSADYPLRSEIEFAVRQATEETSKDFGDVIYIKHAANQGACAARNTGLANANGQYIAFLDDDDEWFPEKIEEQLKGFTDSCIAMVYCGCIVVDEVRKENYSYRSVYKNGFIFSSLLDRNFIGGASNPLIRRECINKVGGFDIKMRSAQDFDLWLRLAMHYPVNFVKKPLLYYYIHNGERISTDWDGKIEGAERINEKFSQYIEKSNKTWNMRQRVLIPLYLKKGKKKKAYQIWLRCVKKTPLNVLQNTKSLLRILFGFDSLLYRTYDKLHQ